MNPVRKNRILKPTAFFEKGNGLSLSQPPKKARPSNRVSQRGITLIEVVVAMAILIIAVFAIINTFPKGIQITKTAERNTVAAFLAQEKVEEIAAMPYGDITCCGIIEEKDSMPSPFEMYQRETEVIFVDPDNNLAQTAEDLGIKQIRTTVYWLVTTSEGEKSISIYTLRSER